MTKEVTNVPFREELPRLLAERGMSTRALAQRVGVSHSHLSRVVRQKDYKTPSRDLTWKVATALNLPHDYFPEYREATVIEHLKADQELRDEIYERIRGGTGKKGAKRKGSAAN